MGKKGVGVLLNSKEARVSVMLLISIIAVFVLTFAMSSIFVSGFTINITSPINFSTVTSGLNVNFTFNATWQLGDSDPVAHENVSDCLLYVTNPANTLSWQTVRNSSISIQDSNITNASQSYLNYTFVGDGNYTFAIACYPYNVSVQDPTDTLNFSSNFSFFLDQSEPFINFTTPEGDTSFNTSSVTTTNLAFTINDSGLGLNWSKNGTVNLSVYLGGTRQKFFSYSNINGTSNLTCNATGLTIGLSTQPFTCNATNTFNANGTFIVNATTVDAAGNYNTTAIKYTLDQIPPLLSNFTASINVSNLTGLVGSHTSGNVPAGNTGSGGTAAQGLTLYFRANFTDNLTRPLDAVLQFFNTSSGNWETLNVTQGSSNLTSANGDDNSVVFANLTFTIPTGRTEFEGENVSFRVFANDTLGNVNKSSSVNLTIQINDTYAPTITINSSVGGSLAVNGTNTTNTTPLISWAVDESGGLTRINITVDLGVTTLKTEAGVNSCGTSALYDQGAGSTNVEKNRNGSFNIDSDPSCTLGNGTHNITVTAVDSWGNAFTSHFDFNIQTGSVPGLVFVSLNQSESLRWGKAALLNDGDNQTNITSRVGIGLGGVSNGGLTGENIASLTYVASCDSSNTISFSNNTVVYPWNATACSTTSENRTLTVVVTDSAGNTNTTVLGFLVDNVAPTLIVHNPKEGQIFSNSFNATTLNVSVLDDDQGISSIGYYLDGDDDQSADGDNGGLYILNISGGDIGPAGLNLTSQIEYINVTGTHTIKFRVNDSVGNAVNSSVITYTQISAIDFTGVIKTINLTNANNVSNVSFYNASGNDYITGIADIDKALELLMQLNKTGASARGGINLTISLNGTAANWNKTTEIYVKLNESKSSEHLANNQSAVVVNTVYINRSFIRFLSDNSSYYGKVGITVNSSDLGNKMELWYFADESNLNTKTNVTECASTFAPSHSSTTICWNGTNSIDSRGNLSVDVFVPHFSLVALVNNSVKPWVNVTIPSSANQSQAMFVPNITVSGDAIACSYSSANITGGANVTMSKSGNVCIGSTARLNNTVNPAGAYNISFAVNDSSGNVNYYVWTFNVTDNKQPLTPNSSRVSTSSVSSTGATITISDTNETINATVLYGSASNTLSTIANKNNFNKSQSISLSSLTAATTYYFNVSVCDYVGNCIKNGTFNFTTGAAESSTSSSTTTTTSSGGGGGSGTGTVSSVVGSKAQVWQSVPSGSSVSLDVNKKEIAVTSVVVNNVKSELKNLELEVAALSANPVSSDASAKVYQYFRINKKNIADSDADDFKISFRVTKVWLSENGLASADMALYRFNSGVWNELVSRVIGTDSLYVNYEADTPGFSSFAVGVKSGVDVPEEVAEGDETSAGVGEEVGPPDAIDTPIPVEAPGKAPAAWIIAAIVVILGILLIVVYQKQKNKV